MNYGSPGEEKSPEHPPKEAVEPPDSFHISSAHGWMELGRLDEAVVELEKVAPRWREHMDFLETAWELASRQKEWHRCVDLAEAMIGRAPDHPSGWIHRSYALHELKQTQEAWDNLRPVASRFPEMWTIPYNLACYACQLGRTAEALAWFSRALEAGDPKVIRELARNDSDLAPIRSEIS